MYKFVFVLIALLSASCFAQDSEIIEKSLTADARKQKRLVDGSVVVRQLVKSGVFRKKPSQRMDYADYYVPQKQLSVLGARLISFGYEYQQKYIGCCVNPGNSVVLLPAHGIQKIQSFARKNKCRFRESREIYLVPDDAQRGLTGKERQALIEVSCKDDYLADDDIQ